MWTSNNVLRCSTIFATGTGSDLTLRKDKGKNFFEGIEWLGTVDLEQHGLNCIKSTYTRIFSIGNTTALHNPASVESEDAGTKGQL